MFMNENYNVNILTSNICILIDLCYICTWTGKLLYCKRYFRWGKFRENVAETFHVGVIFTMLLFPS